MVGNNLFSSFTVSETSIKERNILKNVYGWMAAGLGVTGVTAFSVASNPNMVKVLLGSSFSLIMLFVVQFGLVIYLSSKIKTMSRNTATFAFLGYAFVTGITFSSIF
jgi:FtsH-binding integral membrane protein